MGGTLVQTVTAAAVLAILGAGLTAPGAALEKSIESLSPGEISIDWSSGASRATCDVAYYNICTGQVWVWEGWEDGSVVGTTFQSCPWIEYGYMGYLYTSYFHYRTGAVPGYGFTGTVSVHATDPYTACPIDPPLAVQPILPADNWNQTFWHGLVIPEYFTICHTIADPNGLNTPVTISTDGPMACGNCYPTTRTTNSYLWGTTSSPLCPGTPLSDGQCAVEFLAAAYPGPWPVSVETSSWGEIKALYR